MKKINETSDIRGLIRGISLLEILVVVTVFAILGIIVTQSVILTVRGSKKSESQVRVRENLNYALSVMERQLRNADSITSCTGSSISFKDSLGNLASFSCAASYIASGSAQLTSSDIKITSCSITCGDLASPVNPPYIDINLAAKEANTQGAEGAAVTASTKVYLRTY